MLRVRISPTDYQRLVRNAEMRDQDVSEYVRRACEAFEDLDVLLGQLDDTAQQRALTSFECNVLLVMYPSLFLEMGGVELAKEPANRANRKRSD